jgi:hypothetical protein
MPDAFDSEYPVHLPIYTVCTQFNDRRPKLWRALFLLKVRDVWIRELKELIGWASTLWCCRDVVGE